MAGSEERRVRTYSGPDEVFIQRAFQADAAVAAQHGYMPRETSRDSVTGALVVVFDRRRTSPWRAYGAAIAAAVVLTFGLAVTTLSITLTPPV